MPDSIKKSIMDRVATDLAPLVAASTVRAITRDYDNLRELKALPAIMLADGPETTHDRDDVLSIWTCRFKLEIRIVFAKTRDAGVLKDAIVAEVQKYLEGDINLGGLGRILNAGNEDPGRIADSNQTHRTLLEYNIEYTRKIADPYVVS